MINLFVAILFFSLLLWFVFRHSFFRIDSLPRLAAPLLFLSKVFGGVALFFIYTYYYTDRETADIFKFYDSGLQLREAVEKKPEHRLSLLTGMNDEINNLYIDKIKNWKRPFSKTMLNENRLLIRAHCLLSLISSKNYHLHNILFCFLSFLGAWWLVKSMSVWLEKKWLYLFFLLLLFPSAILWSSGLLKESVLLFCIGGAIYFVSSKKPWLSKLVIAMLFIIILFYTRTVLGGIIFLGVLSYLMILALNIRKGISVFFIGGFVLVMLVSLVLPKIDPLYDYFKVIARKQKYAYEEAIIYGAGSVVQLHRISRDPVSVFTGIPIGFMYGLVQPTPLQSKGKIFIVMSSAENIALVFLFVYLVLGIKKQPHEREQFFWLLFFIAFVYLSFIGMLVPVLGNLARYKSIVMPLLLGSFMILQQQKESKN